MKTGRIPGMAAPAKRRRTGLVVVETPYLCASCGELWTHVEVMPANDEPDGLDAEDVPPCGECGGDLVALDA